MTLPYIGSWPSCFFCKKNYDNTLTLPQEQQLITQKWVLALLSSMDKNEVPGSRANTLLRWLFKPVKFISNPRYRTEVLANLKLSNRQYQRSPYTKYNRYPLLFAQCKKYLSTVPHPQILSFGCATGEEVFTLSELMPCAIVTGVDINDWCIKQCLKKNTNDNCRFYNRDSAAFEQAAGFDALFCMAVFQRTENRTKKRDEAIKGFSFTDFEREVSLLHSKLKPGGLFIIDHADFSFADTACAHLYQPLEFENNRVLRKRPRFNRENKKIAEVQENYRVFVKTA